MKLAYLYLSFFFLLLVFTSPVFSQLPGKQAGYKDFVFDSKNVWLLTTSGALKLVDQVSGKQVEWAVETDAPIVTVAKDRTGAVVIGDTTHQIRQYNRSTNSWHTITTYSGNLTGIVYTSQNQCLLITNKGIVDASSNTTYFPDSSLSHNSQIRYKKGWFQPPVYFIDKWDNLWIGFDYGEWGGDVFCFNTQKRTFTPLQVDTNQMSLNPVSGFCEDDQNVYMSGGVSHMFLTHGSIIKFDNYTASTVFLSKDRKTSENVTFVEPNGQEKTVIGTTWTGGHQIGPIAYNPTNKCLYFYSQYGIFKGTLSTNLSDIKQWQNVLKPNLHWTGGRSNAVGPSMNVLKMQFTPDGILVLLTQHEGLGVYDGKILRFIK